MVFKFLQNLLRGIKDPNTQFYILRLISSILYLASPDYSLKEMVESNNKSTKGYK